MFLTNKENKMSVILAGLTGFYAWGTSINEVLAEWQSMGVFEFILPFLLIFAVVFGILTKAEILGKNKGVNLVIALAAGLLGVQSVSLRSFFQTIFPYAGIGLAVILVALILSGIFVDQQTKFSKYFFYLGLGIAGLVVLFSLADYNWVGGWWWQENWTTLLTFIAIIALIGFIVWGGKESGSAPAH